MKNLIDLEKKINSELTTKINKSKIKHNQMYVEIDKDSLKLIKNDSGLIDSIIDLNLPEEKIIKKPKKKLSDILNNIFKPDLEKIEQKESIFNKPYKSVGADENNTFNLNNSDFKKLNNYIKKTPENIEKQKVREF